MESDLLFIVSMNNAVKTCKSRGVMLFTSSVFSNKYDIFMASALENFCTVGGQRKLEKALAGVGHVHEWWIQ